METFEQRLRTFLLKEKGQVLVRSVALDALQIARTLKFAAAIGARAQALSPLELDHKRMALDGLLEQTEVEVHEFRVLLRQHSADIVARVESDLTAQVNTSVPAVRQHLISFQALHPKETGHAFGTLIENFLLQEVETLFRSWRVQRGRRDPGATRPSLLSLCRSGERHPGTPSTSRRHSFRNTRGAYLDYMPASCGKSSVLQGRASILFTRFVPSCVATLPLTTACLAKTECWHRATFGYERRPHPLRLPGAPAVEHD